jgi:hypothetical protein
MQYRRYIPIAWVLLLTTFALTLAATPASAAQRVVSRSVQNQATTALTANIYLTTATLAPIFQSRINQQVPGAVSSAISNIVSKLPPTDQGWAGQMATTLIQPSATLSSLAPQQNGLAARIRVSLYPGDPQPINASMLVGFAVRNGSSVQVSAQPMNGSPALVSGPLTTLSIPIGHLNSIRTTPSCGSAALAVNLQVPLSLGQHQASANGSTGLAIAQQPQDQRATQVGTSSYVEIPASSLASLGASIGTLQVSNDMTARNISVAVQGGELVITSDIYFGFLQIASATTYVQPVAVHGNLGVKVLKTDLTFLQLFTFPNNSYNQQIQQTLNTKLNGALAGKFYATSAAIGSNSQVPCAASDSLILTGNTSLI